MTISRLARRTLLLTLAVFAASRDSAQADVEIETFLRGNVESYDNNNNGYAGETNPSGTWNRIEQDVIGQNFVRHANATTEPPTSTPETLSVSIISQLIVPPPDISGNNAGTGGFVDDLNPNGRDSQLANSTILGFVIEPEEYLLQIPSYLRKSGEENYLQSRGMRLEYVFREKPKKTSESNPQPPQPGGYKEWFCGMRYFQYDNNHKLNLDHILLNGMRTYTNIEAEGFGPHVGFVIDRTVSGWKINVAGVMQFELSENKAYQRTRIGFDLIPNQLNRPLFYNPSDTMNRTQTGYSESFFGEIRAQAVRPLSNSLSLTLGVSGNYFSDLRYAGESIHYDSSFPGIGIHDAAPHDLFLTTAYANLQFRH